MNLFELLGTGKKFRFVREGILLEILLSKMKKGNMAIFMVS